MEFGPVEKAIEGFLVFFVQTSAKPFPSFTLRFQNITEGGIYQRLGGEEEPETFDACEATPWLRLEQVE